MYNPSSGPTKLSVELHADIGHVLSIDFLDLRDLHYLRRNSVTAIAGLLYAGVMECCLVGHHKNEHLGTHIGRVAGCIEQSLYSLCCIRRRNDNCRVRVRYNAAMTLIDLDKFPDEVVHLWFVKRRASAVY